MKPKTVVLVVEDETLVRLDIVSRLEDEGFIVLQAANADLAITILENHAEISILFTDIDMPGSMDGLKLSAAVRDRWPPVKIVVTSGHRRVEITDMPDGSVFHAKPYSHADVIASFRELTALD